MAVREEANGAGAAAGGRSGPAPDRTRAGDAPRFGPPLPAAGLPGVDEARRRILEAVGHPPVPVEEVDVWQAGGRVLARPVQAPEDLPAFHRSTVDGYAVRSDDLRGVEPDRPVPLRLVGRVRMGEPAGVAVEPGQAVAIPTGGMLPEGSDAVVMFEHTTLRDGWILVHRFVGPGDNVIARGEDAAAGDVLLPAGRRLRAADVGALAGAGITRVPVARRPRVALLLSGDEIVAPADTPRPGQLRDINGVALATALQEDGAVPLAPRYVRDDLAEARTALREALAGADLVVISGGSSVGERDLTAQLAADLPRPGVVLHGVALKPGKPTLFAMAGRTPVFGLPGNPVSALVTYRLFVRPVIARLLGWQGLPGPGPRVRARLDVSVRRPRDREEWVPVALLWQGDEYVARPQPRKSGLISALAAADGLLHLPMDVDGLPAGSPVEVVLW